VLFRSFNTDNDEEFDRIFRLHLRNCYDLHKDQPPAELFRSFITPHDIIPLKMPVGFIHPFIDGTISHFYEWKKAGCYQPSGNSTSMYQQIQYVSAIHFGFDVEHLYVRMDFSSPVKDLVVCLRVVSLKPMHLRIPLDGNPMTLYRVEGDHIVPIGDFESVAYRTILEFSVPFKELSASPPQRMRFYLSLLKDDLEVIYKYFPRLRDLRRRTCGLLSGGEQQMLVIGRALITHPKLMLLDEPSLGLGPLLVEEIFNIIRRINEEERTSILLVEQNAMISLEIAQYGYVMENGRIVMDGPADQLKDNEDIKEFYLGLSGVGQKKSYRDVKHYRRRKRWLA
jgi:branched-chain amino acid transport system ATP-binding protein